ncbi:MAG: type II toxin-antitoxin system RelE/ParE family toxin [Oligoflexia bacterium]|nr:type II toxin-antitoxin system RelE/ParE family toxin [Oligoflexia bacterium]
MSKNWLEVLIYEPARSEIQRWPLEVKKDLGSILTKLQKGSPVGYPDTLLMSTVAPGVFEIRLKDASGIYRAFYLIKVKHGILVFHSFKKKSRKTPKQEIETGRQRLNTFLEELKNED